MYNFISSAAQDYRATRTEWYNVIRREILICGRTKTIPRLCSSTVFVVSNTLFRGKAMLLVKFTGVVFTKTFFHNTETRISQYNVYTTMIGFACERFNM